MKNSKLRLAMLLALTALIGLAIGRLALAAEWPAGETRTDGDLAVAAPAGITRLDGVQTMARMPSKADILIAGVEESEPGRHSVYRSVDGGRHWQLLSDELPSRITALAAPTGEGQLLYAGTESMGVLKSTDGGASWAPASRGLGPMPNATVTSLAVDEQNPDVLRATIGYYFGPSATHFAPTGIWTSTDGGASWSQAADQVQ
jgi:hypothetical protein